MRIAVVLKDRCQPKKCQTECIKFCPRVRSGERTVVQDEKGRDKEKYSIVYGATIKVAEGQRTVAGVSIIAEWP